MIFVHILFVNLFYCSAAFDGSVNRLWNGNSKNRDIPYTPKSQGLQNASFFRNISRLLNTILTKQDKNFRPHNTDNIRDALEVEIDISVRSMGPISEQNMKRPSVIFAYDNGAKYTLSSQFRWIGTGFTEACPIEIGSLGYFTNDIVYKWKNVELDDQMGNMLSQYKVLDVVKSTMNVSDYRYPEKEVSVLKVYFKLQRQQGFYILQIYTPCTLLVVMSWVSFWINKEASPARVALGIMTVLSMSTLGFGLRTDLPKVSHSTALDIYIIICFGFVFAAMVEYAVINYAHVYYIRKKLHDLQGLESNKAIESMRMFTAGFMGRRDTLPDPSTTDLSLTIETKPWYKRIFSRKQETSVFYRMAVKAAKARRKLTLRDPAFVVNRIDNVSKVVFPLLYVIINLLYWCAFLYWIPDEINEIIDKFETE